MKQPLGIFQALSMQCWRGALRAMLYVVVLLLAQQGQVLALSPDQQELFNEGINYYDSNTCDSTANATASSAASGSGVGPVYMVGDSITVRSENDLNNEFSKAGIQVAKIDAGVGRAITVSTTPQFDNTPGLQAVKNDTKEVQSANTIIVALGTNDGTNGLARDINSMIGEIKNINSSAMVYWVNVFSNGGVDKTGIDSIISKNATLGYTVIDTTNANIQLDPADNIHPVIGPTGTGVFAQTVVNAVKSGNPGNSQQSSSSSSSGTDSSCACNSSGSTSATILAGNNNVEKTWNYFAGKGLDPMHIAAIIGNLQQESGKGIDPELNENGSGDTTTQPLTGGSDGWGIAQWTYPYQTVATLVNQYNISGPIYELSTQLDLVWAQMNHTPPTSYPNFFSGFTSTSSLYDATEFFRAHFENGSPGNRQGYAQDVLAQYGSGTGSGAVATTTSGSGSVSSATCCPSSGAAASLPGGQLLMADNASVVIPPPQGATVMAGYLHGQGETRAWTASDWSQAKSNYKYILPIYVAYSSFATPQADADSAVSQSKEIGLTPGSAIALDIEEAVASQAGNYPQDWSNRIKADGFVPMVYTSLSTASVIPSGVLDWIAATNTGNSLDGHAAHQYDFAGGYDLSVVDGTKVPLWPTSGGAASTTAASSGSTPSGSTSSSGCASATSATPGQYQNPFRDIKNLVPKRIDEGVDYQGDGNVYALGNGTVTWVGSGWFSAYGQSVVYKLRDGPAAGHSVYFSENITPQVKPGDTVTSNTVIAIMHSSSPRIETGWVLDNGAAQPDEPAAGPIYHSVADGSRMAFGQNFSDLLKKLGAPPGDVSLSTNPGTVVGQLPSGWPTW